MAEDLLTRIQHELQERMDQLRPAMEERDRLRADLQALDAAPDPPVRPESTPALDIAPEPSVAPERHAAVLCFPARREPTRTGLLSPVARRLIPAPLPPTRTRMVSPKVLRLMHTPRRPALERPGNPRVSARTVR
jgi:hypothetical protein